MPEILNRMMFRETAWQRLYIKFCLGKQIVKDYEFNDF